MSEIFTTPPFSEPQPEDKPDYGVDSPYLIKNFLWGGGLLVLLSPFAPQFFLKILIWDLRPPCFWSGVSLSLCGLLMLFYSKLGKYRHRNRMLNLISWEGRETTLDIGTGRGLLILGAAKRIPNGHCVGIDIWTRRALSANTLENFWHNAALEGVSDRVEIREENAVHLSFPDAYFDVILSNRCLNHLKTSLERAQACHQIARILKPGGTALVSDFRFTWDYSKYFRQSGLEVERLGPFWFDTFPPLTILRVRKLAPS